MGHNTMTVYNGLDYQSSNNSNDNNSITNISTPHDVTNNICADLGNTGSIAILCAEPDMGKTTIINNVCAHVATLAGRSRYVDLCQQESSHVATRVVSVCREMIHALDGDSICLLALDDVPYLDDHEAYKVIRAVKKFILAGGNVIIAQTPEQECLVNGFPGAQIYRSSDLGVSFGMAYNGTSSLPGFDIDSYIRRVPRLLRAALLIQPKAASDLDDNSRYLSALADVAEHSVRKSLMEEERQLRLAMIEMGHGTVADLRNALGQVDPTLFESIAREAPFFGVDPVSGRFSCAAAPSYAGISTILHRVSSASRRLQHVSKCVAGTLAARGDFLRAGVVIMACDPEERSSLILKHPAEFIDAGYRHMVEQAVSFAAQVGSMEGVGEARLGLSCVTGTGREYDSLRERSETSGLSANLRLMVELREAVSVKGLGRTGLDDRLGARPGMARSIVTALKGLSLLQDLRFGDAYSYLLGAPERLSSPQSLASCVLWAEYLFAMGMSGNSPTQDDIRGYDRALGFATMAEAGCLVQLLGSIGPLVSVLAGRVTSPALVESCAQCMAIMGMVRLQAVCLIGAAVADQRSGSRARAYVRLGQAAELADKCRDSYLKGVCHILTCAARSALGEGIAPSEVLVSGMPARLSAVARMLAAVIGRLDAADLDVIGKVHVGSCPAGTSWLINILANEFGDLSRRFRDIVPRPWIDGATRAAMVAAEFDFHAEPRKPEGGEPKPAERGYQLDISVLGGFHVSVNGVPVEESHLERRRAKSLLGLLAALPGHSAKRYEVMESIWPELDYHDARQRVYEATSVLRTELTSKLGIEGVNPLVSNRGAGTIGLNPAYVHCDIDDFTELAQSVLSVSRMKPSDVLSCCARLERLYRGDLFVPQVDGAGVVTGRRNEMRQLFADVMVLASGHALTLGNIQAAAHYAENACDADGMREDAELCLIKAFAAAGRHLEAEVSYRSFTERVVKETKRPPSRKLREAYGQLVSGGEEEGAQAKEGSRARAASA